MLTASALYRAALPYPHRREVRVEVFHDGVRVGDLRNTSVVSGSVSASLTSRVTRSLAMDVVPELYPALSGDLLDPDLAILRVSCGIGYPDGSREVFPVFTGRVSDVERDASGKVTVRGDDRAADVVAYQFEQPEASSSGDLVTDEIERLITQAVPDAVFGTHDSIATTVPAVVWDVDRGQALDDLAEAGRARWYVLGDGSFVVRLYPYVAGTVVLALADGAGGTVSRAGVRITRDGTANSVTVVSERMDGTDPIRVTARNTDTSSATRFDGPYGRVSQVIKVQTPVTAAEAGQMAQTQLAASLALRQQWSVNCVPDATLEPGDTVSLTYRGATAVQVIDSITYPLASGDMTLSTRSSIPQPLTEES